MLKYNEFNVVNVFGGVYGNASNDTMAPLWVTETNRKNFLMVPTQGHQKQHDKCHLGPTSGSSKKHRSFDRPRQLKATPPVEIKASIDDRNVISDNTF